MADEAVGRTSAPELPGVEPPKFDARLARLDLGLPGVQRFSGYVRDEFLRELKGKRGLAVYREMGDNDPTVGAVLFALTALLRKVEWRVEPASRSDDNVARAEYVASCVDDMEHSWGAFVADALSMVQYGHAVFEVVYKVRRGPDEVDPSLRSRHDDGRIGWRKFGFRAQETLERWMFAENGDLIGVEQRSPPDYRLVRIPAGKMLLFRTTEHKGNPEGRSALRSAYRPWYFGKKVEEVEAIGVERDLAGLPVVRVPAAIMSANSSADQVATFDEYKRVVVNVRRDEQEGVVLPSDTDERGNYLYDLQLLTTGSRRQFNLSEVSERYARRIAMTMLADFIMIGHERVGSFALASSKTNLWAHALGGWLKIIREVLNRDAVPALLRLDGEGDLGSLPTFEHGDVETQDLADLAGYVAGLAAAGMPLFPDPALEEHLRRQAGLPMPSVDTTGVVGDMSEEDQAAGDGAGEEDDDVDDEVSGEEAGAEDVGRHGGRAGEEPGGAGRAPGGGAVPRRPRRPGRPRGGGRAGGGEGA